MPALTPEQQALKQAAQDATPGPWIAQHDYDGDRLTDAETGSEFSSVLPENGTWPEDTICEVWGGNHLDEPNAKFIAAANPQAILALFAQIESMPDNSLDALNAMLKTHVDRLMGVKNVQG